MNACCAVSCNVVSCTISSFLLPQSRSHTRTAHDASTTSVAARQTSVDDRQIELAETRRIADDLDLGDQFISDRQTDCSEQASSRRHHDADGPIHERVPCEAVEE